MNTIETLQTTGKGRGGALTGKGKVATAGKGRGLTIAERARAGRACYRREAERADECGRGYGVPWVVPVGGVRRGEDRHSRAVQRLAVWARSVAVAVGEAMEREGWRALQPSDIDEIELVIRPFGVRAWRAAGVVPGFRARHGAGDVPATVRAAVWWFDPIVGKGAACVALSHKASKARKRARRPVCNWGAVRGVGAFVRGIWQAMEVRARSHARRYLWGAGAEGVAWNEIGEVQAACERGAGGCPDSWDESTPRAMLRDPASLGVVGHGGAAPGAGAVPGLIARLRALRLGLGCYWAGGLVTSEQGKRGGIKGGRSKHWDRALRDDLERLQAFAAGASGRGLADVCALGLGNDDGDASAIRSGERAGQRLADSVNSALRQSVARIEARAVVGLQFIACELERARGIVALVESVNAKRGARGDVFAGVTLRALDRHVGGGSQDRPARVTWGASLRWSLPTLARPLSGIVVARPSRWLYGEPGQRIGWQAGEPGSVAREPWQCTALADRLLANSEARRAIAAGNPLAFVVSASQAAAMDLASMRARVACQPASLPACQPGERCTRGGCSCARDPADRLARIRCG